MGIGWKETYTTNKITLGKSSLRLKVGDSQALKVTKTGTTKYTVICTSTDPEVARISSDGLVTTYGEGKATVALSYGDSTASCTVHVKKAGHRYQVFDESLTWTQAKLACEKKGGHLVTITSQEEQNIVFNLAKTGTKLQYWLGGRTKNHKAAWITGEEFTYSYWASGQPDNFRGQESYIQMYMAVNPRRTSAIGQWNDITENNTLYGEEDFFSLKNIGYICEWEQ